MSEEQKKQLQQRLWNIADALRGKMDADEFRRYMLGFIFYKYLSEKLLLAANKLLEHEDITDYTKIDEDTSGGKEILLHLKENLIPDIGYFLRPTELFSYLANKGTSRSTNESSNFILSDLSKILVNIQNSTMGAESEDDFDGLFSDIDLGSQKLGKTEDQKNELISKILYELDQIDFRLHDAEIDILGDAYEYLIGQFASAAGKKAGEFYTPQEVSRVLAKIVTTGKTRLKSVYDPTCGSGSLLLRVAREVSGDVTDFYGQEMNHTTYNLARMNLLLHGVPYQNFNIRQEDTLEHPQHLGKRFEAIVANPPFSAQWKADSLKSSDDRFSQYGSLAPKSYADFAFVQHMIYQLDDNGTMAVVLPHGALFRGGAEQRIRKYLIEDRNYLDAVIGLPANLFYGTSIPACIMVYKKCREHPEDILFIDASAGFEKVKNQNILREEHIEKIISTYRNREVIEKYSHLAKLDEIRENDYNLNISRYVDTFEEEEKIDIDIVSAIMKSTYEDLITVDKNIEQFCIGLNIPMPIGYNIPMLKTYKKGIIQKIFSREIKFRNENGEKFGEWEVKKLGEVVRFSRGKGISKSDIIENGATECIRYGELYTTYGETISSVKSKTNIDINDLVLSEENDVIIPASGETEIDIATASCVLRSGIALGGDLNILKTEINGVFLSYYLNNAKKNEIASMAQGIAVVHLYASQLKNLEIEIPSLPEQQKIASFLSELDKKIDAINSEIESTEK